MHVEKKIPKTETSEKDPRVLYSRLNGGDSLTDSKGTCGLRLSLARPQAPMRRPLLRSWLALPPPSTHTACGPAPAACVPHPPLSSASSQWPRAKGEAGLRSEKGLNLSPKGDYGGRNPS